VSLAVEAWHRRG